MKKEKIARGAFVGDDCFLVTEEYLRKNFNEVLLAAHEGRLVMVAEARKAVAREAMIENVRRYVRRIDRLVQPSWKNKIGKVWDAIFEEEIFVEMLMPSSKARKCRDFNKYSVMRIVGFLRSHGVYDECVNDSQLCAALEDTAKDLSYRSYIGRGFDLRETRKLLTGILGNLTF